MAGMDAFGADWLDVQEEPARAVSGQKRQRAENREQRESLYRWDHVATQALNLMGVSVIEGMLCGRLSLKRMRSRSTTQSWRTRRTITVSVLVFSRTRLAVGVSFAFELLDVFLGQFHAMFVPHKSEQEFIADGSDLMPVNARFL